MQKRHEPALTDSGWSRHNTEVPLKNKITGNSLRRLSILLFIFAFPSVLYAQIVETLIPAKTPVRITLLDEVSTLTAKSGDSVKFIVSEDLMVGDVLVAPKSSPVTAEVIHAQKSGIGGKSGELLMAVRYIDLGTVKIPLRSLKPYAGENKTNQVAMLSAIPIVGLFSTFMHGGEIILPAGTQGIALVAKETLFVPQNMSITAAAQMPPTQSPIIQPPTTESIK